MSVIQVNDAASNFPESLEYYANFIRKSKNYIAIFETVYTNNKTKWTIEELCERSGLTRQAASKAARALANKGALRRISSGSGRQTIYGKSAFPKNHAQELRRDINRTKAESKRPTKRTPQVSVASKSNVAPKGVRSKRKAKPCNILYLTASPASSSRLRVDKEIAEVQQHVRGSRFRDQICIQVRPAASSQKLIDGLNDLRPKIVQFSGHADLDGIELDSSDITSDSGDFLSFGLLVDVFKGTSTPPKLVILNGCKTVGGAQKLLQVVPAVISMTDEVSDTAAITFALSFYAAVGAKQPLDKCFTQAVTALKMIGSPDSHIPQLDISGSVKGSQIKLF